jgi:hypothetical protein
MNADQIISRPLTGQQEEKKEVLFDTRARIGTNVMPQQLDGFRTTDSFRFDTPVCCSSSISLSSSSGYGSRLSLSATTDGHASSSQRRSALKNYFRAKISRHKSLASLLLSNQPVDDPHVYEDVWNLAEQIEKVRTTVEENRSIMLTE